MPTSWENKLILYIGYPISQKCQSSMVKSYISAIRAKLMDEGIRCSTDEHLLNSLTKACRLHNDTVTLRFPIHKQVLEVLVKEVRKFFDKKNQLYLKLLYVALFTTAYYGMFRVGEITKSPHVLLAKDVHIRENKKKMLFLLHSSKTHSKASLPQ